MSTEKRLERVVTALGPRERAAMFLRDYKAGNRPDPNTARFTSEPDRREFWRLVSTIYFCNDELADIVLIVREQVATEALRLNWLRTVRLYSSYLWIAKRFLADSVREPVTESEAKTRKPPKRGFDVFPDSEQKEVERIRRDRRFLDKLAARWGKLDPPLNLGKADVDPSTISDAAAGVACLAREQLASCWTQLQAVNTVLAEYGAELGEDPLKPSLREFLDQALADVEETADGLGEFIGEWQLSDDHAEAIALTRELAQRVLVG